MLKNLLSLYLLLLSSGVFAQEIVKRKLALMGCRFEITVVATDQLEANAHINTAITEISRIETLISSWNSTSQTSLINKNAGKKAVKIDKELFELIEDAIKISQLTDGAFDITYASIGNLWKFDGSMTEIPSKDTIESLISKIGYKHIILNKEKSTILLAFPNMKISFGAIGKGYAADKAKELLIKKGVSAGIINASGDLSTWGEQPNGSDWKIAITNPLEKTKSFALLPIKEGAVVTSGNYETYVIIDGEKYDHIIDPRTGYPSSSGLISATVFAPNAELADALATSIFVMGAEVGINRINQLPKVECILIDNKGNIHKSNNIKIETL